MIDEEKSLAQFNNLWTNTLIYISGSDYTLAKYIWDQSLKFNQIINMNYFNLDFAKNKKPVITQSGLPVTVICFDRKHEKYKLIGLVTKPCGEQDLEEFTEQGEARYRPDEYRLKMGQKNYFVNIGQDDDGLYWTSKLFSTYEEATAHAESIIPGGVDTFIKTVIIPLSD